MSDTARQPSGPSTGTLNGIQFWERNGSFTVDYTKDKISAQRTFIVSGSIHNAKTFCEGLLGPLEEYPGFPIPVRGTPSECPGIEDGVKCVSAKISGKSIKGRQTSDRGNYIDYSSYWIVARYEKELNSSLYPGIPYLVSYSFGGELFHHDEKDYKWASQPDAGLRNPVRKYKYNIELDIDFPAVDPNAFDDVKQAMSLMQGTINSSQFTIDGYPPETVLYQGASADPYIVAENQIYYRIGLKFRVRSASWLKEWNPDEVEWMKVVPDKYKQTNLNTLIEALT